MKSRMVIVALLAAAWVGLISVRLGRLQVLEHEKWRGAAESQQLRVLKKDPRRGAIYDRRGREMAISVEVESAWADPSRVQDPVATASRLSDLLGLDRDRLLEDLSSSKRFVWVARKLDLARAGRLREEALPGIELLPERKRYYPLRELAAHVVGFTGIDNEGLAGVESRWNDLLSGRSVSRTVLRDALRRVVQSPELSFGEAEPGADLVLTIDAHVQYLLERELTRAVEEHGARSAMGLLMDPHSGAILALASVPTFDPNRFQRYPSSHLRNRPVLDAFEPGSTFKLVTAAAALEANLLDPSDLIDCREGAIELAGVRIRDHKPFGDLTFREVIAYSSNVGAIEIGLRVGREDLYRQITRFGFGAATGVDLPGGQSSRGIVHPAERWHSRATAYISFGQGVAVTALQLANAFAAVANGGTLYQPHVVAAWRRGDQITRTHQRPQVLGRPIAPATARSLERLLEAVVEEGTGEAAAIPGYRVAGKTGTAQKPADGGYSPNRHLASFAGFAPARDPALVGLVVIDEPGGYRYHGGEVAAPVFSAVVGEVLPYLGIRPDRRQQRPSWERAEALPPGGERPRPTEIVSEGIPDFTGLTARQALARSSAEGLKARLSGTGYVTRQWPPAGADRDESREEVDLWLSGAAGM